MSRDYIFGEDSLVKQAARKRASDPYYVNDYEVKRAKERKKEEEERKAELEAMVEDQGDDSKLLSSIDSGDKYASIDNAAKNSQKEKGNGNFFQNAIANLSQSTLQLPNTRTDLNSYKNALVGSQGSPAPVQNANNQALNDYRNALIGSQGNTPQPPSNNPPQNRANKALQDYRNALLGSQQAPAQAQGQVPTQNKFTFQQQPSEFKQMGVYSQPVARQGTGWLDVLYNSLAEGQAQLEQQELNLARMVAKPFGSETVNNKMDQALHEKEQQMANYQQPLEGLTGAKKFVSTGLEALPGIITPMAAGVGVGGAAKALGAGGKMVKAATMLPFGLQAAGGYARQAELEGASYGQQVAYGLLGGLAEAATEAPIMTKWLDLFGGKFIDEGAKTLIGKFGKQGLAYMKNALAEGFQEAIVDPMTGLAEKAVFNPNKKWVGEGGVVDFSQMTQDGYTGVAMSVMLTALGLPGNMASHAMASKLIESGKIPSQDELGKLNDQTDKDVTTLEKLSGMNLRGQGLSNTNRIGIGAGNLAGITVQQPEQPQVTNTQQPIVVDDYSKMSDEEIRSHITEVTNMANDLIKNNGGIYSPELQPQFDKIGSIVAGLQQELDKRGGSVTEPIQTDTSTSPQVEDSTSDTIPSSRPEVTQSVEQEAGQDDIVTHPENIVSIKTKDIGVDADRFQFKSNTNDQGVSKELKGATTFDKTKAGVVTVWKDNNGKYWVVNGHHRVELANRTDTDSLNAYVLNESDGITEKQAREIGALQNIAEGKGTEKDAAQVFRDGGYTLEDIQQKGLSPTSQFVKRGYHISRLNDRLWNKVVNANLAYDQAAIIGEAFPNDNGLNSANQNAVWDYIDQEGPVSNSELREVIDQVRNSDVKGEQVDLLGGSQVIFDNNFRHKAKLITKTKAILGSEKSAFAATLNSKKNDLLKGEGNVLNDEANKRKLDIIKAGIGLIDIGKNKAGDPINAIFNKYANEMAAGMSLTKAAEAAAKEITDLVAKGSYIESIKDTSQIEGQGSMFDDEKGGKENGNEQGSIPESDGDKQTAPGGVQQGSEGEGEGKPGTEEKVNHGFKPGDRVSFELNGKTLTGTIKDISDYSDINKSIGILADVDVDQIEYAGGVPIGRRELVQISKLKLIDEAKSENSQEGKNSGSQEGEATGHGSEKTTDSQEGKNTGSQEGKNTEVSNDTEKEYNIITENGDKPSRMIAAKVADLLSKKQKFTSKELFAIADEAYGGTKAEKAYTVKDAYDAMELGVNQYLYEQDEVDLSSNDIETVKANLKWLQEVMDLVPASYNRTDEMIQYQQFSTPPPIAYLANWLANTNSNDTVLEPSAGIGGLAIFAKIKKAKVIVNELSERRLAVIKNLNFDRFFKENGEQLNNILPEDVKPTEVIMNPPFSSSIRTAGKNNTKNATMHIQQALRRLEPNGRLIAILGEGMAQDRPAFRDWWNMVKGQYNVRANVSIDGKNYAKYGTTWGIQLVVIDNTGPTKGSTLTGSYSNLDDVINDLRGVQNDRPTVTGNKATESDTGKPGSSKIPTTGESGSGDRQPVSAPTDTVGSGGTGGSSDSGNTSGNGSGGHSNGGSSSGKTGGTDEDNGRPGRPNVTSEESESGENTEKGSDQSTGNTDREPGGTGNVTVKPKGSVFEEGDYVEYDGKLFKIIGTEINAKYLANYVILEEMNNKGHRQHVDYDRFVQEYGDVKNFIPRDFSKNDDAESELEIENKTKDELREESKSQEEGEDNVYSEYRTQSKIPGSKKHPGKLSESAAMGAVSLPEAKYKPNLPKELIENGTLSDAQLESIVYAGQAHEQILPGQTRRAFFLGDGTGVGKGRQISGIILDNFRQGRKKAVWISKNADLFDDAIRDWTSLDQESSMIFELGKTKLNEKVKAAQGILYTTYNTMANSVNLASSSENNLQPGNLRSRVEQIVDWLGADYDGVIVFDEAHMMANSGIGNQKPTGAYKAGKVLQERLPNARIVYASATGATEIGNLAYAERLGLWGPGTAFDNSSNFMGQIEAGGIAAMELVSRDMKSMGVYLSRNLSYDGVQYENLEHELSPEQKEIYDTLAGSWQIVMQNMEEALKLTEGNKNSRARAYAKGRFFSTMQSFFNQIMTSASMPSVLNDMRERLNNGESVVVQLVNTQAAELERQLTKVKEEEGTLDDVDVSPKGSLLMYLDKAFPTQQYEEYTDENGKKCTRPVVDSNGKPVQNPEAVRMKNELMTMVGALKIPEGPIDMIINEFGPDAVAEITGRKERIVTLNGVKKTQKLSKKTRDADSDAFQAGEKRILIFSDAGGTGKSYHASLDAKNQQHRVHYLVQPGWSAMRAVQGFGRTHRSNEASSPTYVLVSTNLKGQKRFISTIARRLDQMGALTKGQRQAGSSGIFKASDNLENRIARDALVTFYRNVHSGRYNSIGIDSEEFFIMTGLKDKLIDKETGQLKDVEELRDVPRFLNRILAIKSDLQNSIFDTYAKILEDMTEYAIENGLTDNGLENIKADKISILEEKDIGEPGSNLKYYRLELSKKTAPLDFSTILEYKPHIRKGFYQNAISKRVYAVYEAGTRTNADGTIDKMVRLYTQEDGRTTKITLKEFENNKNYELVKEKEAAELWKEGVKNLPEFATDHIHLISGTLLPIWNRLPEHNMRVVRAKTDKGDTLLGRTINENEIDSVLRKLGTSRTRDKIDLNDVYDKIMNQGFEATLVNSWKLQRKRVAGEYRIELIGKDLYRHIQQLKNEGVYTEMVGYTTRFFVPIGDEAVSVLSNLTEYRPIDTVVRPGEATYGYYKFKKNKNQQQHNSNNIGSNTGKNTSTENPKKMKDMINDLIKTLGIPARIGRFHARDAAGIYKVRPEVIRTRMREDAPTLAHEAGHHLDKIYGLSEIVKQDQAMFREIMDLGEAQAKAQKLGEEGQIKEGIAEFLRHYLTEDTTNAPKFEAFFKSHIDKKIMNGLDMFKKEYDRYRNATPEGQMISKISFFSRKTVKQKVKDSMPDKSVFARAYENWIDELKPLSDLVRHGVAKSINDNPFLRAWAFRGWVGKAEVMLKHGVYEVKNGTRTKVCDSLMDIIKPVEKELDDFLRYCVAKRVIEKENQLIHTGFDLGNAYNIYYKNKDNDVYNDAHEKLQKYQDVLLRKVVDAGMLSEASYQVIKELNQDYIPFYRVLDLEGEDAAKKYMGKSFTNLTSPIKPMKGDNADIINPLESIVKNTYYLINMAERNEVGRALINFERNNEGLGKFIEHVDPIMKPTSFQLKEIKGALKGIDIELNEKQLETIATIFRPIVKGNPKDNTVVIWENGHGKLYQLHPDIYRAVTTFDQPTFDLGLKILTEPAKILRAGAVLNPDFAFKNPLRDMFTAAIYSKYNFIPFVDTFKGLSHVLKQDDIFTLWLESGGASSEMVAMDRDYLGNSLRKMMLTGQRGKIVRAFYKNPIEVLRELSEITEQATRVGDFAKGIKKEGMTPEGIMRAGINSRDVTLDFSRYGHYGKEFNKITAFFNATLQGQDKMLRTLRGRDTSAKDKMLLAFKISMYITAPSIALYLMYGDDDKIKELPAWRKNLCWNIPTENHVISIPKPFELGILFGSLPERIIDYLKESDPKVLKEWGASAWENGTPNLIPTATVPILEMFFNKSFFTGLPIVNQTDQGLEKYEQYNSSTSEVAKRLGAAGKAVTKEGFSPKVIDNTIYGLTGGLGRYAVQIADMGLTGELSSKPSSGLRMVPGVRGLVTEPYANSESVNVYYDNKEVISKAYSTASKQYKSKHPGVTEKAWDSMVRNDALPTAELRRLHTINSSFNDVDEKLKKLKAQESKIRDNENMSATAKQAAINQINKQRIKLVSPINNKVKKAMETLK